MAVLPCAWGDAGCPHDNHQFVHALLEIVGHYFQEFILEAVWARGLSITQ